jgi:uncharacterized protein GlcG (DUF336 family)
MTTRDKTLTLGDAKAMSRAAETFALQFGIQHRLSGRAVIFGGGIPVLSKGGVMGAVGVSAGTVEQDVAVALAAMAALEAVAADVVPTGRRPD